MTEERGIPRLIGYLHKEFGWNIASEKFSSITTSRTRFDAIFLPFQRKKLLRIFHWNWLPLPRQNRHHKLGHAARKSSDSKTKVQTQHEAPSTTSAGWSEWFFINKVLLSPPRTPYCNLPLEDHHRDDDDCAVEHRDWGGRSCTKNSCNQSSFALQDGDAMM